MLRPMVLCAHLVGPAIGRLHDSRASAGGNHIAPPAAGQRHGPARHQPSQRACVLVVARHLHGGLGQALPLLRGLAALHLVGTGGLLVGGRGSRGTGVRQQLQLMAGHIQRAESRRSEEDHRVLDALAPEARHRLVVLGHDAQHAGVGRVQEIRVLIRQRRGSKRFRIFSGHRVFVSFCAKPYGVRLRASALTQR